MTDHPADRRRDDAMTPLDEENPESGRGRVGSGAPVSEDPSGDVEYRGTDDRDAGPIFVETPDGEQEYGRRTR